ncbi:MAG TPA: hypothetical protein VN634_12480 [Candidatus Limnocylindrales bacterium]|nr:hypothetical protein [Candidatus Limnocylindrales bacterium]
MKTRICRVALFAALVIVDSRASSALAGESGAPASVEKHGLSDEGLSGHNGLEAFARATNATVVHLDPSTDPALAARLTQAAVEDQKYELLFSAEGLATDGSADFEFAVDSTVSPLSVNVSGSHERPRVVVRDGRGAVVAPVEALTTARSDRLLFKRGAPGRWTIHLQCPAGENVQLVVKGDTELGFHHLWPVRPSAETEYTGPLETGKQEMFEFALTGDSLFRISVNVVSLDGHVLNITRAGNDTFPLESARVKVTIPSQSFRLQVEGDRPDGEHIARMHEASFDPGKLEQLSFFDPERAESEETCRFLSHTGGSSFYDSDKINPGSGGIFCSRNQDEPALRSNLFFHLPASGDGSPRTTTLRSSSSIHVTKADCEHWQQLFDRYPKQLVNGARRASWSFRCAGPPESATGEIEVTVDSVEQSPH